MDVPIPPHAFAWPFTITHDMVDVQGRVANHEIVRLLVETAARHSDALGWDLEAYRRLGAWWVVRRHEVDYHVPAVEGDDLLCHTWPSDVARASAERRHVLLRPADGAVIAVARNVWALVDLATGRPRRIPPEVLSAFDPAKWRPA
jgi:acyl-CoA thioester hydrolase